MCERVSAIARLSHQGLNLLASSKQTWKCVSWVLKTSQGEFLRSFFSLFMGLSILKIRNNVVALVLNNGYSNNKIFRSLFQIIFQWPAKLRIVKMLLYQTLPSIFPPKNLDTFFQACIIKRSTYILSPNNYLFFFIYFFIIWVFFHKYSRFTRQQGKGEAISLTPLYHFHLLHWYLDINRATTAKSSPLHIVSSWTRTGNLWFPSTSC